MSIEMTKGEAARLALSVFLNSQSVDQILDAMVAVRRAWRADNPTCSLEENPALVLLSGSLLYRTTGIFILSEVTAEKWLSECSLLADNERPTSA